LIFNAAEDTSFNMKKTLNCRGRILDLSTPVVMGILNVTPDSFYDGDPESSVVTLVEKAAAMITEGASIIDIGGQSTRPGSKRIEADEEWNRIAPVVRQLSVQFPETVLSVDTFYPEIAVRAAGEGVSMINDISGGQFRDDMFETVGSLQLSYVLMHIRGIPETMQADPQYENVVENITEYFRTSILRLQDAGVRDIILDPGFGFGKTLEHNYSVLSRLKLFSMFGLPILSGLSRKSLVTRLLGVKPADALNGTTVLNTIALLGGTSILRVHDVREAVEAIRITGALETNSIQF
jgi:dihydropteroate synthase